MQVSDAIEAPNLFTLSGRGLSITNNLGGIDGRTQVTYHTLHRTSIAGIGHGQLSTVHTVRLRGTASRIES